MDRGYILCNYNGEIYCVAGLKDREILDFTLAFFEERFPFLTFYLSSTIPDGVPAPYLDKE